MPNELNLSLKKTLWILLPFCRIYREQRNVLFYTISLQSAKSRLENSMGQMSWIIQQINCKKKKGRMWDYIG